MAEACGARTHKRPPDLSRDDVLAIEVIKEQIRTQPIAVEDIIVILQVTCPLRTAEDIENAYVLFEQHDRKSGVVSVSEYQKPPELAFRLDGENRLQRCFPEQFHLLTQKHEKAYRFNTGIAINTAGQYLQQSDTLGKAPLAYVMPPERGIDIDYSYQLHIAELLYRERERKHAEQS